MIPQHCAPRGCHCRGGARGARDMDAADYAFTRIPDFDMKALQLFDSDLQCGKKRVAEEDRTDKGVGETVKKAKMAGPVNIGREEAARYWQSLIVAGRGQPVITNHTHFDYRGCQVRLYPLRQDIYYQDFSWSAYCSKTCEAVKE